MTSEQFCYWLQGFFELKQTIDHREGATPETMKMIEDHLKTVFVKVTPEVKIVPSVQTPTYKPFKELDLSQIKWPDIETKAIC